MRCHRAAGPSEDGFELRDGGAVVRRPSCCDLPHTVRRAGHANDAASVTKHVTERFLGERLAPFASDEGEISTGPGL